MKQNYFRRTFLLAIFLCVSFMAAAQVQFEVDGIIFESLYENTVEVHHGADIENVVLPSTVAYKGDAYTVTCIGKEAFRGCSSLTSIVIPNSVTSIKEEAFNRCFSLTSIVIPNSVTSIGKEAFQDCSSLTSVVIGNSVTSIRYEAFRECSNLTSVVSLSYKAPSIESDLFYGISSDAVLSIPAYAKDSYEEEGWFEYFKNIKYLTDEEVGVKSIAPDVEMQHIIYDLNGCRVLSPTRDKLYIVNGKTVVY